MSLDVSAAELLLAGAIQICDAVPSSGLHANQRGATALGHVPCACVIPIVELAPP